MKQQHLPSIPSGDESETGCFRTDVVAVVVGSGSAVVSDGVAAGEGDSVVGFGLGLGVFFFVGVGVGVSVSYGPKGSSYVSSPSSFGGFTDETCDRCEECEEWPE
jgi:hypothetical protein